MEGSEACEGRRINSKGRKCTPVHSARSNEMQLTPRILRFIRLLPPPRCRFCRAFGSSGYEYLYPTVANRLKQPTNLSAIFHRPFPSPSFLFFFFFLPFFLFSRPSPSFSTRLSRDNRHTRKYFNENVEYDIENSWTFFRKLTILRSTSRVIKIRTISN